MVNFWNITKNKTLEIQIGRIGHSCGLIGTMMISCDRFFSFDMSLSFRGCHRGSARMRSW